MIINFLAGPGAGKSTLAAGLFYKLKMHGINCEFVREYAKYLHWTGELSTTCNTEVTKEQYKRLTAIANNVPLVIHDTSLLLGAVYGTPIDLCLELESKCRPSHNIFIGRRLTGLYQQEGRSQTLAESMILDDRIVKILTNNNINFTTFFRDELELLTVHVLRLINEYQ